MPKQDNIKPQVSQYDKIIKENLEVTLPAIIRDVLGLNIAASEELPDDIQHTKERKPDALKKVTDTDGNTYVLQVEFQVEDEKEMVFRMAEYSVMLMRKYQLPIKQYLIFLRDAKPIMPTQFDTQNHKYSFTLIRIAEASYKLFLKSDDPEVKMLAILANFDKDDSYTAVKAIVDGVESFAKGDFAKSRHMNQLRIFVQLRSNVKHEFEKIMQSVSTFFREENDFLYIKGEMKGEIKGEERKTHAIVENLIVKLGLPDEQAADVAEVSVEYVAKVRAELGKK
jgi:predicted transposase/invertase (TIGR01784 family)